jgi:hypothetical protein
MGAKTRLMMASTIMKMAGPLTLDCNRAGLPAMGCGAVGIAPAPPVNSGKLPVGCHGPPSALTCDWGVSRFSAMNCRICSAV